MSDETEVTRNIGPGPRDPEELEAQSPHAKSAIAAATTMGAVHLTVSDLARSVDYYTRSIGLRLGRQDGRRATLGSGERDLLVLEEVPGARPADGHTGLYHFALLLPERADLARWLAHAAQDRVTVGGASDHFVSEALYLTDPDHHGIEIYWDRPRSHWEGVVAKRMTSLPLDIPNILGELEDPGSQSYSGMPAGTVMGHVHLRVAEIPGTVEFYRSVLGFELMARYGAQAAFLAAGGYHHHLGGNTWESAGASPAPPGSATLQHFTIVLPNTAERDRVLERIGVAGHSTEDLDEGPTVLDPSGNRLLFSVG